MDYQALRSEINQDPLTRGYSGMTNAQIVTSLNTKNRTRNRTTMDGSEVFNAIRKAEFNALTSASQQRVWDILHLGTLNPFGLEATLFVDIFGNSSSTISALQGLRVESISRAEELGLGPVSEGQVAKAKAGG